MKRKPAYTLGIIMICAGVLALLSSAGFIVYNVWDENRAADSAAMATQMLFEYIEESTENHDPEIVPEFIEIGGELYIGLLSIPALSLELPVNNEWSYPKLKESPCRYAGSIDDLLVIAAHNYKNHFGSLTKLVSGDTVLLTDAAGGKHQYLVEEVTTLKATDIDAMTDSLHDLTLFTCTFGGKARIAVRCVKV